MSTLLEIALSNLLMAAALAVPAVLAGWWGRRPALTHGLWLLVLLKLVTPPIYRVPIAVLEPAPEPVVMVQAPAQAQPDPAAVSQPAEPLAPEQMVLPQPLPEMAPEPAPEPPPAVAELPVQPDEQLLVAAPEETAAPGMPAWRFAVALLWPAGAAAWLLLAVGRLVRFQRLLRFAEPAPAAIQSEAEALASTMGVRCPRVLLLPGTISPMLWAIGGAPRLLLPAPLLQRLRPTQQATLLAHELAHWRRGDHRIRWLEVIALALYWWCPFVWWARRQLHQAEEECCDAWVVALFPDAARDYALTLVETIDFLSGAPQALPPVASGVGHVRLLQRRLTMILRGATPKSLTRRSVLLLAGFGFLLLPFVPSVAQQPANSDPNRQRAADLLQGLLDKNGQEQAALAGRLAELLAGQVPQDARQRDLEEKRANLQKQLEQLHAAIEQLKQAAKAAAKPLAGPMGADSAPKKGGGGGRASGIVQGMGAGMKPGGPMPSPMMGAMGAGKGGTVEQRLEAVEKKLDILLWEITNLRRDMTKGHGVSVQIGGPPGGFANPYRAMPGMMMPPGSGDGPPAPLTGPGGDARPGNPFAPGTPSGPRHQPPAQGNDPSQPPPRSTDAPNPTQRAIVPPTPASQVPDTTPRPQYPQ